MKNLCLSCVVFVFVLVATANGGGYGSAGGAPRSSAGYGSAGGGPRSAPAPAASRSAGGYGSTGGGPRSPDTFGGPGAGNSRSVVEVPPAAPAVVSAPAPVAAPAPRSVEAPPVAVEIPLVARIVLREIIEVDSPEVVSAPGGSGGCENGQCQAGGSGGGDGRPPRLIPQYRDARKEMHDSHKASRLAAKAYRHSRQADEDATERSAIQAAGNAYRAVKQ